MRSVLTFFSAAVLLFASSCGSDDGAGSGGAGGATGTGGAGQGGTSANSFLGSCDTRSNPGVSEGQCRDWNGSSNVDVEVSCNGIDGTFDASIACPSEARVGSCTLSATLGVSATYNYYSPKYTDATAQDHCTSLDGTWKAG